MNDNYDNKSYYREDDKACLDKMCTEQRFKVKQTVEVKPCNKDPKTFDCRDDDGCRFTNEQCFVVRACVEIKPYASR